MTRILNPNFISRIYSFFVILEFSWRAESYFEERQHFELYISYLVWSDLNTALIIEFYVAPDPCDNNSSCLIWNFETVNGWHTF